jgi:hypothetical protein
MQTFSFARFSLFTFSRHHIVTQAYRLRLLETIQRTSIDERYPPILLVSPTKWGLCQIKKGSCQGFLEYAFDYISDVTKLNSGVESPILFLSPMFFRLQNLDQYPMFPYLPRFFILVYTA